MPIEFQRAKVPDPTDLIENDIAIMRALDGYGSLSIEHPCIETDRSRGGVSGSDSETSDGLRTTGHFLEKCLCSRKHGPEVPAARTRFASAVEEAAAKELTDTPGMASKRVVSLNSGADSGTAGLRLD